MRHFSLPNLEALRPQLFLSPSKTVKCETTDAPQPVKLTSVAMAADPPSEEADRSVRKRNAIEATDRVESKRPRHGQGLCLECQRYDLRKITESSMCHWPTWRDGLSINNVGTRFREPAKNQCPLCRILSSSRASIGQLSQKSGQKGETTDDLRAFRDSDHFNEIQSGWGERFGNPFSFILAVVPSGYDDFRNHRALRRHMRQHGHAVCNEKSKPLPRNLAVQVLPANFDPNGPRSWLQYCKTHHKKLCSPKALKPNALKLLDCYSLAVKQAADEDTYVALSYVWGKFGGSSQAAFAADSSCLPSVLPNVVLDAIEMTKTLGFRYLWVDKYCIDQADHGAKYEQIQQMESVYENSELTIIAAAGSDEDYGLPGVGNRPRAPQLVAETKTMRIVSTMQHPHDSILNSTWSKRGWTFQEGVLSRRRLVFTEEQTYFECKAMNCYESVTCQLSEVHTKDGSSMYPCFRSGIFSQNFQQDFGGFKTGNLSPLRIHLRYLRLVEQYSSRELEFDHDALLAFAGITREFERRKHPVLHL